MVRTVVVATLDGLFIVGGWLLLAQKPPELVLPERSFASIDGLKSAGIKMRIGLVESTISPRCAGFNAYSSARLKPVIEAI